MSEIRSACEASVRLLLDDLDPSSYGITSERLHEIVKHEALRMGRIVGLGASWSSGAVSLVQSTRDYVLPTSASTIEYQNVQHLILDSRNWPMTRVSMDVMDSYYMGYIPFSNAVGVPYLYTMWEDSTQQVNIRIFPTVALPDSITIFTSQSMTVLASDSDTIPFGRDLLRALEKSCAAKAWKAISPDKRKVGPELIADLQTEAQEGVQAERVRMIRFKRTSAMALMEA